MTRCPRCRLETVDIDGMRVGCGRRLSWDAVRELDSMPFRERVDARAVCRREAAKLVKAKPRRVKRLEEPPAAPATP